MPDIDNYIDLLAKLPIARHIFWSPYCWHLAFTQASTQWCVVFSIFSDFVSDVTKILLRFLLRASFLFVNTVVIWFTQFTDEVQDQITQIK